MSERASAALAPHLLGSHVAHRAEHRARPRCIGTDRRRRRRCGSASRASPPAWRGRSRGSSPAPSRLRKRFSGLRSRCTIPFSCAAASAWAICAAISSASRSASAPARSSRSRERLALEQLHDREGACRPSCPRSKIGEDVGMRERRHGAAPRARSAPARSRSPANAAGSTLIATSRSSLRVGGAVDLAHAALAELGGDLVGAQPRADHRAPIIAAAASASSS